MFLKPLLGKSDVPCRLVNQRNRRVVAETVFTAFDSASRRKGLLGRDGLAAGTALIIAPTNAIHTWFMRFDIDVAFVAKDGHVVKVSHRLRPWRLFAALRGYAAIELPPGALASSETASGDTLALEPVTKSDSAGA